jgi:hypothetical protein
MYSGMLHRSTVSNIYWNASLSHCILKGVVVDDEMSFQILRDLFKA